MNVYASFLKGRWSRSRYWEKKKIRGEVVLRCMEGGKTVVWIYCMRKEWIKRKEGKIPKLMLLYSDTNSSGS